MKGFLEVRGKTLRLSYDAKAGEFVNVPVAHAFAGSDPVEQSPATPSYLWSKTDHHTEYLVLASHTNLKHRA